ncbi:MAG TPA: hypothetical protein VHH72_02620 [Solirubrobacterales bacterium]|jgi:hypothetical protein|nr:hypothetical protein [Solirubrobacterales bacterium]
MRRGLVLVGIALLALALSAGGAAAGSKGKQIGKLAGKQCAQERKALGHDAFEELYGKPATPNCLGVKAAEVKSEVKNASKACRAERDDIGAEAFAERYGTNKNKRNAFGKCVSRKAAPELSEDTQAVINAAKACKAEQSDPAFPAAHDGKTFDEFYGTNHNHKNAFGKCVSGKVHTPPPAAPTA